MKEISIDDLTFEKYIEYDQICKKIKEIAQNIMDTTNLFESAFFIVMNGAFIFASHLLQYIEVPIYTEFIQVSSYNGVKKQKPIIKPLEKKIPSSNILLIDDILDTGETIYALKHIFQKNYNINPKVATLFVKDKPRNLNISPDYYGIIIPDIFIIGFGLDYKGKGRNLKDIYRLKE